ncbi:hypothetical protein VC83_01535 [Pseudogymnoascus destructans]|uniref:Uncharacterized protein n=1 Tax=Pseudogymnoascus destructans TaxID=655981 RepID=A0A177AI65_9PEZI|nr:uncharacterized protein VC83_01535 [Pseudogymnoascus destructans]OAF61768.1 hypothetical protein VC83_01535 [Pseudogymnoascus destructans]
MTQKCLPALQQQQYPSTARQCLSRLPPFPLSLKVSRAYYLSLSKYWAAINTELSTVDVGDNAMIASASATADLTLATRSDSYYHSISCHHSVSYRRSISHHHSLFYLRVATPGAPEEPRWLEEPDAIEAGILRKVLDELA